MFRFFQRASKDEAPLGLQKPFRRPSGLLSAALFQLHRYGSCRHLMSSLFFFEAEMLELECPAVLRDCLNGLLPSTLWNVSHDFDSNLDFGSFF